MAKIKKTSPHYKKGLNQKGKSIWLSVLDFNPVGVHNYKIKAIKGIKNGFAEWQNIWVHFDEITLKQRDDKQLTLDFFSPQEMEENLHNPRYFNQRRFEVITKNQKQYVNAPDRRILDAVLKRHGIQPDKVSQVPRLTKKELND